MEKTLDLFIADIAILEDALRELGCPPDRFARVICASSFSLIVRMLREGLGVSFAYSAVCAGQPDIATFHLEGLSETREFNFVFLKGADALPLIRELFGEFEQRQAQQAPRAENTGR